MHLLVIIAEYNPFHQGHAYHIKKAKEETGATHSLILMGGNFLQRGDVALENKFLRARRALQGGADLVAELPFIYASSWAREFAGGGVRIFQSLPLEATLSFGSETGSIEELTQILHAIPQEKRSPEDNYAHYLQEELQDLSPKGANDVLALEYLRAYEAGGKAKNIHTIKRIGQAYHDEESHSFPSASSIRREIREGKRPWENPLFLEDFQEMIFGALLTRDLKDTYGTIEGLDNRLLALLSSGMDLDTYIKLCSTKRYRPAAIRRLLIHHLMNYSKTDHQELKDVVYLRPLAYTIRGTEILKALKDTGFPVISSMKHLPEDEKVRRSLGYDLKASRLYHFKSGGDWEEYKRNLLYNIQLNVFNTPRK